MDRYKYDIYAHLSDASLASAITRDASTSRFHACERFERCEIVPKSDSEVVYVNPLRMSHERWIAYLNDTKAKLQAGQKLTHLVRSLSHPHKPVLIIVLSQLCPLARHSTLPELQEFVRAFRPKRLVPNFLEPKLYGLDWACMPDMFKTCMAPTGAEAIREEIKLYDAIGDLQMLDDEESIEDATMANLEGSVGDASSSTSQDTRLTALVSRWATDVGLSNHIADQLRFVQGYLPRGLRVLVERALRDARVKRLPAYLLQDSSQEETQRDDEGHARTAEFLFGNYRGTPMSSPTSSPTRESTNHRPCPDTPTRIHHSPRNSRILTSNFRSPLQAKSSDTLVVSGYSDPLSSPIASAAFSPKDPFCASPKKVIINESVDNASVFPLQAQVPITVVASEERNRSPPPIRRTFPAKNVVDTNKVTPPSSSKHLGSPIALRKNAASTPQQLKTGENASFRDACTIPFIDLNTVIRKRKYTERAVQTPEVIEPINVKKPRLQSDSGVTPASPVRAPFDSLPTTPRPGYNTSPSGKRNSPYRIEPGVSPQSPSRSPRLNAKGLLSPRNLLSQLSRKVLSPRTKILNRPAHAWQGAECFNMTYNVQFPNSRSSPELDSSSSQSSSEEKQCPDTSIASFKDAESTLIEEETFETILETSDMLMDWDRAKYLEKIIRDDLKHGRTPELPRVGKKL